VFQRPTPFPGTVADNLAVAHPDAGTEELSTALKRVALDPGLLGQDARTLSGGELQRMCLARTLVTQPETLLLHEPTSALDDQPKRVFEHTCAGRKLGYRFWPGLSCGRPVFVEQSAQTLSASDRVDPGGNRDHVRFVFGSTQKHSVALVAAPGVVMGDVDVEYVV